MVLLTVTASIVEALKKREELLGNTARPESQEGEPALEDPAIGKPISHGQIIDIWKTLRDDKTYTLENLLRGTGVYVPPPPPKPVPSNEYKALMSQLRREEEQRAYERMINPTPAAETFSQHFPNASTAKALFAEVHRPSREGDMGDDDVTYNDVHRQLMLILNFVVSIVGVAATLWVLARWWSTPARLFLAMGGSILVGIAEVAVYSGYIWHLGEAKKKEIKVRETREVMRTWVVGKGDDADGISGDREQIIGKGGKDDKEIVSEENNLRRRKDSRRQRERLEEQPS